MQSLIESFFKKFDKMVTAMENIQRIGTGEFNFYSEKINETSNMF